MHVGFSLLTLFPGRVGGSESYARGLLGEFARGRGPERLTVLANRHVAEAYRAYARGPVELRRVGSYRAGDGLVTRALAMAAAWAAPARAARDAPPGLDVLHYPVTVPIPLLDAPTVVTIHDVSHLDRGGLRSLPLRRYRRWAYDGAARAAAVVIATSRFARERIAEGMEVAAERIEVVAPGIDHALFNPQPARDDERRLAALGLPARFVVYPANLWPHKNHRRLLEALARVEDRELGVVLAGQDYGRLGQLAGLARQLGIAGRVRHVGQVEPRTMAALYRRALATVIPSLHEGFGFPALEAMACGCPVASSGRGALDEVSGEAALRFDPESSDALADSIDRIVYQSELRSRLVAAGRRLSARYNWEACARRHVEIYARARDTPRPDGRV
ncbi:MAG TPA: glycosyltransferase family 1 protein [Solirubrobacteraceae bacterium]|nr:glycosyltransferase family 1 protein [Solirubrobacteraceae bacterium]